jgi:hypothetical protein
MVRGPWPHVFNTCALCRVPWGSWVLGIARGRVCGWVVQRLALAGMGQLSGPGSKFTCINHPLPAPSRTVIRPRGRGRDQGQGWNRCQPLSVQPVNDHKVICPHGARAAAISQARARNAADEGVAGSSKILQLLRSTR